MDIEKQDVGNPARNGQGRLATEMETDPQRMVVQEKGQTRESFGAQPGGKVSVDWCCGRWCGGCDHGVDDGVVDAVML